MSTKRVDLDSKTRRALMFVVLLMLVGLALAVRNYRQAAAERDLLASSIAADERLVTIQRARNDLPAAGTAHLEVLLSKSPPGLH